MTTQTTCRAITETISERIADHDLDNVTIQIDGEDVVLRHYEWSARITPYTAPSVLYQLGDLTEGSPASTLHTLMYF